MQYFIWLKEHFPLCLVNKISQITWKTVSWLAKQQQHDEMLHFRLQEKKNEKNNTT